MDALRVSCSCHEDYPLNLIHKVADRGHLTALKSRLDFESKRLCHAENAISSVVFRDFFDGDSIAPEPTLCDRANFSTSYVSKH